MNYKISVLPGDGIGPEVMGDGTAVLNQVAKLYGFGIELEQGIVGGASIDAHGKPLIDPALNLAKQSDAVLLGAMGGPKWDGDIGFRIDFDYTDHRRTAYYFFTIVLLYTLSGPLLWCLTELKHRREQRREVAKALP
jgi:isocitrate/isopropylmalate dehydrogenase